jgi:hypothetical protein
MEHPKLTEQQLTALLSAIVSRCVLLECQLLALRRLLDKYKILADDVVEEMIEKVVQTEMDILSKQKSDGERLAAFFRKYEGPIQ